MNYGWKERKEFDAYVWRRFRARDKLVAIQSGQRTLVAKIISNHESRDKRHWGIDDKKEV